MSNAAPQKVHVGEILAGLRAADHNAFVETWRKVNQTQPKKTAGKQQNSANRLEVTVFNTETLIDADFPILKLTAPVFSPTDRESVLHEPIAFNGATPDADTDVDEIAILQGPIGAGPGGRGRGVISGYTYVHVNWTDEAHTHCRPKDGDNTQLESAASGIKIVAHEEIPDPEYLPARLWALVKLGGGGSAEFVATFYVATETIGGATGDTDEIVAGSGLAQQYGLALDGADLKATPVGEPVTVYNFDPAPYVVGVGFYVATTEGGEFIQIMSGFCSPYTIAES